MLYNILKGKYDLSDFIFKIRFSKLVLSMKTTEKSIKLLSTQDASCGTRKNAGFGIRRPEFMSGLFLLFLTLIKLLQTF